MDYIRKIRGYILKNCQDRVQSNICRFPNIAKYALLRIVLATILHHNRCIHGNCFPRMTETIIR